MRVSAGSAVPISRTTCGFFDHVVAASSGRPKSLLDEHPHARLPGGVTGKDDAAVRCRFCEYSRRIKAAACPFNPGVPVCLGTLDPGERLTIQITCRIVYYMSSELVKQTITFQLNQASGVPAYLQIVQQVEQALRMGTLRPGDQLPTVKQVVAEVTVNPNTVTKAYKELEHAGLGRGTPGRRHLRPPPAAGPPPEEQTRLARGLERWVERARVAGLDGQAMEAMLRSILRSASDRGVA